METNRREYCVKITFIEIYNRTLKDLLDEKTKKTDILVDKYNITQIKGVDEKTCKSLEEVMDHFKKGSHLRKKAQTVMNNESSRSHSIFTVSIQQKSNSTLTSENLNDNAIRGDCSSYDLCAKFHFIDLAGSECVNYENIVRFTESNFINNDLMVLKRVFESLCNDKKDPYIPFRDSYITRFLRDSFGNKSNTLMICCVSSSSVNLEESLKAVMFASEARNLKMGRQKQNRIQILRKGISSTKNQQNSNYELELQLKSAQIETVLIYSYITLRKKERKKESIKDAFSTKI